MRLVTALCLITTTAAAQEFVTANGPLSDDDFYRLVSCAAPPGGNCQKESVRWSADDARNLSVGFVQIEGGYPEHIAGLASTALDAAISTLNVSGAHVHIRRSYSNEKPNISIHLLTISEGDTIRNTGLDDLDGTRLKAAKTMLWWRANFTLIKGAIVFGKDIAPADLPSVMLEEVTQSLGLLTDIAGPYHETRSIFSETSNQLTQLGQQDVMALRRHYP